MAVFTNNFLKGLKPAAQSYEERDAGCPGLLIRVGQRGKKVFEVVVTDGRKRRRVRLGTFPDVSLATARRRAADAKAAPEQHAGGKRMAELWEASDLPPLADGHAWLRRPESGAVMLRGRAGAVGAPFNLGEMTVTRAALRLATGEVGHAWVQGRDKRKATLAALADALMQTEAAERVETAILAPLREEAEARRTARASRAAATRVEFFTLVRGEDA